MRLLLIFLFITFIQTVSFSYAGNDSIDAPEYSDEVKRQFDRAVSYARHEDYKSALPLYISAANHGHIVAQHNLGEMYMHGVGVEIDQDIALEWYMKAAYQGDISSQHKAAKIYYSRSEFEKSFSLSKQAAEQGYADSQVMLANHYFTALGVEKNYIEGLKWMEKAADQGNKEALDTIDSIRQLVSEHKSQ